MNNKIFFKGLFIVTVLTAVLLFALHTLSSFAGHELLSAVSIAFFFLLTVAMYYSGSKAVYDENKHQFSNVVMTYVSVKMLLSIVIIMVYNHLVQPTNKLFILPFFITYLIFTTYESYFMMKLGKVNV